MILKSKTVGTGLFSRSAMAAVLAIYAQENGQGMMFQVEGAPAEPPPTAPNPDEAPKRPHLRVIK